MVYNLNSCSLPSGEISLIVVPANLDIPAVPPTNSLSACKLDSEPPGSLLRSFLLIFSLSE